MGVMPTLEERAQDFALRKIAATHVFLQRDRGYADIALTLPQAWCPTCQQPTLSVPVRFVDERTLNIFCRACGWRGRRAG